MSASVVSPGDAAARESVDTKMIFALKNAILAARAAIENRHVSEVTGVSIHLEYGLDPNVIREHEEVITENGHKDVSVRSYRFAQLYAELGREEGPCSTESGDDGELIFSMDSLFSLSESLDIK